MRIRSVFVFAPPRRRRPKRAARSLKQRRTVFARSSGFAPPAVGTPPKTDGVFSYFPSARKRFPIRRTFRSALRHPGSKRSKKKNVQINRHS